MWVTKLLIPVKKKDFLPKNDQIWPKTGIFGQFGPGHAGLFSALLVGRLVVVARGLYLARHLFTLYMSYPFRCKKSWISPLKFKRILTSHSHNVLLIKITNLQKLFLNIQKIS